jgi:hypothetical protein
MLSLFLFDLSSSSYCALDLINNTTTTLYNESKYFFQVRIVGEYRDHQIKANGLTQLLSKYYEWLNQADDEDSICKVLFLYIVNLFTSIR